MKKFLYGLIRLVLVGVILFSGYKVGSYLLARNESDKAYTELANEVEKVQMQNVAAKTVNKDGNVKIPDMPASHEEIMALLTGKNEDAVGYLEIQGTENKYPVVQTVDNEYYLTRGFDKSWNVQGTVFMDKDNSSDYTDRNTVLYGHAMYYGTEMFGIVRSFLKQDYVDNSPKTFTVTSKDGVLTYRLVSLRRVSAEAPYRIPNQSDEDFIRFLEEMRQGSVVDFGYDAPFSTEDQIMTLSTCTNDNNDEERFAMVGVLIDED